MAAVVTTGPLTSVKEQATGAYVRALSARGFAAVAFDHRTFGESGGQPRQLEQPEGKAADVTAAVTALAVDERTRSLPVLAVGICAGGYMARAVTDDTRLRPFAGVAGYYSDAAGIRRVVTGRVPGGDRPRASGGAALASDGGWPRPSPRSRRWRRRGDAAARTSSMGPGVARWATTRTSSPSSRSRAQIPFDAQEAAARIRVPFLLVHSEQALAPPLARQFYAVFGGPKSELWLQSQGQIDFYDDPRLIGPAVDAIAAWYTSTPA